MSSQQQRHSHLRHQHSSSNPTARNSADLKLSKHYADAINNNNNNDDDDEHSFEMTQQAQHSLAKRPRTDFSIAAIMQASDGDEQPARDGAGEAPGRKKQKQRRAAASPQSVASTSTPPPKSHSPASSASSSPPSPAPSTSSSTTSCLSLSVSSPLPQMPAQPALNGRQSSPQIHKQPKHNGEMTQPQQQQATNLISHQNLNALHPKLRNIECRLENAELWHQFHALNTEMIITKTGRRMFPTLRVSFHNIDPNTRYGVFMDIRSVDNKRYRYAYHKSCWQVAGKADPLPKQQCCYPHPDSPFSGELLSKQVISFEKVKLTNNDMDKCGHIILNSMHKYQPQVHLVEFHQGPPSANGANGGGGSSGASNMVMGGHRTFVFPETVFTAVTAYQNQLITKLKIDSNPFAKGFRDSSRLSDMDRNDPYDFMSAASMARFSGTSDSSAGLGLPPNLSLGAAGGGGSGSLSSACPLLPSGPNSLGSQFDLYQQLLAASNPWYSAMAAAAAAATAAAAGNNNNNTSNNSSSPASNFNLPPPMPPLSSSLPFLPTSSPISSSSAAAPPSSSPQQQQQSHHNHHYSQQLPPMPTAFNPQHSLNTNTNNNQHKHHSHHSHHTSHHSNKHSMPSSTAQSPHGNSTTSSSSSSAAAANAAAAAAAQQHLQQAQAMLIAAYTAACLNGSPLTGGQQHQMPPTVTPHSNDESSTGDVSG